MSYLKRHGARRVPQWAPIPGSGQVPNSAGGFAWEVDDWARLRRFLILGSEGGSYYATEWTLTRENAQAVERCIREDGAAGGRGDRAGQRGGPGAEERPGAVRARDGRRVSAMSRRVGRRSRRCRGWLGPARTCSSSSTFVEQFRGWGRSLRRAVGGWYAGRPVDALAYQAVKYRQRDGVTHRDVLRLAHPAGNGVGG